jgi:hypothetical protein
MRKIILLTATMLALVACKPSVTVTDPKTGEKSKITASGAGDNQTVTIDGPDGKGTISVSKSGEAPSNMPAFMPPYPGGKYEGSFSTNMSGDGTSGPAKGGIATFTTTDNADKVLAFYKDAFTRAGLKETASGDMSGMKMISYSKGDSQAEGVQVMASPAPTGGGTSVQLVYGMGQ